MRPASYSTPEPPTPLDDPLTMGYINDLRRRIEVQVDSMQALANQIADLQQQIAHLTAREEALSLDLAIKHDRIPGWSNT
jgi:chromosome segregation ATPase